MNDSFDINQQIKDETLNLKALLLAVKKECEEKERILKSSVEIGFIKDLGVKYYPQLAHLFVRLSELMINEKPENYDFNKRFIRENLYLLVADPKAELNRQICEKPLGYAGDYIVADYFYKDGYSGKSAYAKFIDRFTMEAPLTRAHINRRQYLAGCIKKLAKRKNNEEFLITSFACGTAPEVFDTFDDGITNVRFNLLDGEKGVVAFLEHKLSGYPKEKKNVTIFLRNILNLLRDKDSFTCVPQDLIYCAGFFDYIKKVTASKVIGYMLDRLKSGGILIVVNVSKHDEHNVYLRIIGEWELHHRSHQELLATVPERKDISWKKVVRDPKTKSNLYLIIKKA